MAVDNIARGMAGSALGKSKDAYVKPATGIPSTDMSSSVQTSLGLIDTAIQPKATESYTILTSSWTALASSSPYTYSATATASQTLSASTIVHLENDDPVGFATYGFAVGSISGQTITFYSIGKPDSNVTLSVSYAVKKNSYPIDFSWCTSLFGKFSYVVFPSDSILNITLPEGYNGTLGSAFRSCSGGLKKLTINGSASPSSMNSMFSYCSFSNLEEICLNFYTGNCTNFTFLFQSAKSGGAGLKITGMPIDFSSFERDINVFLSATDLADIRFAANSLSCSLSMSSASKLTDASLVSIANSLSASVSGQTLTLYSTKKTRCSSIMGNVVDGSFVQDDTGATSLATFITSTKGWTLG